MMMMMMMMTHRIKLERIHRKVMKTLRRFIKENDMDFDEAAEKRKFLLNSHVEDVTRRRVG